MKADALNARSLFDGKVHYEIPVYQRPYVWNEEDQWAPLWDDIVRVAEKVVAAAQDTDALEKITGHFLGAIVYESRSPIVGDVTRHLVIDGQQRTTTLQILIDAVHQVIAERGHELMAEDLEGLILNRSTAFAGRPERFKLWPSRYDQAAFSQAMDPREGWVGEHRIVAAHDFFREEADRWMAGKPDADGILPPGSEDERVWALSSTLQHRLFVVAINLTGHDDSQLIFETLNDRGTPLLKADLIKNWIFKKGEEVGADVRSWPDTYWEDFDDDWWREEIVQGRHSRSRIDIFLQYWLTMRLRDEVVTDEVFRRFTEYAGPLMADVAAAEGLLAEMRRDANTFRNFAQLSEGSAEATFYSRIVETMEMAATSPLLLWMLSDNHNVPDEQVGIGLSALESWVIRRTLLRYTTKDVNRMMVAILKHLDSVPQGRSGESVRDYLAKQSADARIWPTDQYMKVHLPAVRLYGNVRQSRLRVVLGAVENNLRNEKHEDVALPSGLEIEHVMPQGWREHWDPVPRLSPEEAAERDHRVNGLGNLTLVTKKLNSSLSNRPWTDAEAQALGGGGPDAGKGKRSLLNKYSLLVLSKDLTAEHADAWTDEDIEARSRFLAEQVCKVWPGPPAGEPLDQQANSPIASGPIGDGHVVETATDALRRRFETAMKDVYARAKQEAGYDARAYLGMLAQYGGLGTARRLLATSSVSEGFVALWERKRIDLAVENVVLRPEFESLFTDEERDTARRRLAEYDFDVD